MRNFDPASSLVSYEEIDEAYENGLTLKAQRDMFIEIINSFDLDEFYPVFAEYNSFQTKAWNTLTPKDKKQQVYDDHRKYDYGMFLLNFVAEYNLFCEQRISNGTA